MLFRRLWTVTATTALFMVITGAAAVTVLLFGGAHKRDLSVMTDKMMELVKGVTTIFTEASANIGNNLGSTSEGAQMVQGKTSNKGIANHVSEVKVNVGDAKARDLEQAIFEGINELRTIRHAPTLRWDEKMAEAARARALEVVETQWFGAGHRLKRSGYMVPGLGDVRTGLFSETMGFPSSVGIVRFTPQAWLQSQGHRSVMMDPEWKHVGVGVVWLDRPLRIDDEENPEGIKAEAVVVALYRR